MGFKNYSTPIDMWSIGCIFAEMKRGKPLFTGKTPEQQLQNIFKGLGTPTHEIFPKITELPGYRDDFPKYTGKDLTILVPGLEDEAYDLLRKLLHYDPTKRPTASDAMQHSYLASTREADLKREASKSK